MTMPGFDLLPPLAKGAAVAALAALMVAVLARVLRRPGLAGAAAGIGLVAGFVAVLGGISASPRQLIERLPLLAALGLAAGLLAARPGRWTGAAGVALGVSVGAWWMVGAPLHAPDLLRAAPVLAGLLVAMSLAWSRGGGVAAMAPAWAVLAAGLWAATARGPHLALALAGLGALAGALPWRGAIGHAARLPLALALAGIAAVPLVARAAPADMAAAAGPALALLAGPWVSRRLRMPGADWLGPVLAGAPAVGLAFLLR